MASWVYILRSAGGSCYVGCTTDLERRVARRQAGTLGGYTWARRPEERTLSASNHARPPHNTRTRGRRLTRLSSRSVRAQTKASARSGLGPPSEQPRAISSSSSAGKAPQWTTRPCS